MIKGRKIITVYNDGYKCETITKKQCSVCLSEVLREPDKHYGRCDSCSTFNFSFYKLTPTQQALVTDDSNIVIALGGMNNGKTDASIYKMVLLHALKYSNAVVLTVCHSLESIQQTVVNTIRQFLPEELVAKKNGKIQWNQKKIVLKNGSIIYFFPSDKSEKFRSLNASLAILPEFTALNETIATQSVSRLRKKVLVQSSYIDKNGSLIYLKNKKEYKNIGQLIIDGNPEEGHWVNTKYLAYVSKVYVSRGSDITDLRMLWKPESEMKNISLHNYPTFANPYSNDGNFIELQKTTYGEDSPEYQRYIFGKIVSTEGLVYPNYLKAIVAPFALDVDNFLFYGGADLGFNNPCAYVLIAESQTTGVCYAFRGYKKRQLDIKQNADMIKRTELGIPKNKLVYRKCDSQGISVTHGQSKKSPINTYSNLDILFSPASKKLDLTTAHLNSLINSGKLKIFSSLTDLTEEFPNYVKVINKISGKQEIKKQNCDFLDALRYACEDIDIVNTIEEKAQQVLKENKFNPFSPNKKRTFYTGYNN